MISWLRWLALRVSNLLKRFALEESTTPHKSDTSLPENVVPFPQPDDEPSGPDTGGTPTPPLDAA